MKNTKSPTIENNKPETAIKVDGISKAFKLPHEKQNSIKSLFVSMFRGRRTYEKQQFLKNISFEIKKGEFFGIVGRNGSGKSTLLKLLAGIYTPDKGQIKVNGKLTPFIELGVGFNPELTGRENVFLNGALLGFGRKDMDAMYDEIVEFAELEKFMDQKLKNYSSGMQVRLAFSIAIRANTSILLLDEVLAVGDQSFQEKCIRYFTKIKKSATTVVFVTHDMSNVEKFCDRVLVLDKLEHNTGIYNISDAISHYNSLNYPQENTDRKINTRNHDNDIYIESVQLINSSGEVSRSFMQGDEVTVRIKISSDNNKIDQNTGIVLGLSFHDSENVNLAGPNSKLKNYNVSNKSFDYKINSIPFVMGEYRITVSLFDENLSRQFDLIDKKIKFFVNSREIQHGKVKLDGTWI